jgi:hypothetical protein
MPAAITNYLIVADKHRFNVKQSTIKPLHGAPVVDLITLTYPNAKDTYTAGEFTLAKVASNDAAFHLRYDIYYRAQLLGYMLTDRTKKYGFNQHLRPVHVENEAFYTLDYGPLLSQFLRVFGLEVANNSEFDISIDTQESDPAKALKWYDARPTQYHIIKREKEKGLEAFTSKDKCTGKPVTTTYWNIGSFIVTVKVYDKTADLRKNPKQYILDWYVANGFDLTKPVYRIEVSIKARALKDYRAYALTDDGEKISVYRANNNAVRKASKQTEITSYNIDLEQVSNPAYLSVVFQHFFPIDIRKKDASRPTNCSRIQLIDYTIYGASSLNITVATRPTANKLLMEKNTLKNLVLDYYATGDNLYFEAARATAQRHQLTEVLAQLLAKFAPAEPQQNPSK